MCLDHYRTEAEEGRKGICVSGQRGSVPLIFAWDSSTGEKISRSVLDKGAGGVQAVSINDCGDTYCAVDMSNDHNVYVFDTNTGAQKHKMKGDTNKIYDIVMNSDGIICTVGSKHVKFWDFSKDKVEHRGIYGAKYRDISSTSHCVVTADVEGNFISGGSNG